MPDPRLAFSLVQLRAQVNAKFPMRSKVSDGWIGDARHAAQKSDHNPDSNGVVRAIDITDETAAGCDGEDLAAIIRASRDSRVSYIIFNMRICRSYAAHGFGAWEWAPYGGTNAHKKHVHVSVKAESKFYDDVAPWRINVA